MIIYLILGVICGAIAVAVASKKGRNQFLWFLLSFVFGGIPLLILAFLSNLNEKAKQELQESTKQCPKCAELIKKEATICRFCNTEQDIKAMPLTRD